MSSYILCGFADFFGRISKWISFGRARRRSLVSSLLYLMIPACVLGQQSGTSACGIGFWKNHLDTWGVVSPTFEFDETFGVNSSGQISLLDALKLRGGKANALMRHAVAAYLSSLHPELDYAYSPEEVIAIVRVAVESGTWGEALRHLEVANSAVCPTGLSPIRELSTTEPFDESGGVLEVPNIARVEFRPGILSDQSQVTVSAAHVVSLEPAIDIANVLFGDPAKTAYEVRISIEGAPPSGPVRVALLLPIEWRNHSEALIQAMVGLHWADEDEVLDAIDRLESTTHDGVNRLECEVPPEFFTSRTETSANEYSVIVYLSLFEAGVSEIQPPAEGQVEPQFATDSSCPVPGLVLEPPIATGTATSCAPGDPAGCVISGFGPRQAPSGFHWGVDWRAREPTPVFSMAEGEVLSSGFNSSLGNFVMVLHSVSGRLAAITVYGHLKPGVPAPIGKVYPVSSPLARPIGVTGTCGDGCECQNESRCRAAHLHTAFVPGATYDKRNYRDPIPCVQIGERVRIRSITPGPGARIAADSAITFHVEVVSGTRSLPANVLVEVVVRDRVIVREDVDVSGPLPVLVRFPNYWSIAPTDVLFRAISGGVAQHDTTISYNIDYNWATITRGAWAVEYDWLFTFASKLDSGQRATEHHTGAGYMGDRNHRVGPFPESFTRVAWVNNYDFVYDGGGHSYLDFTIFGAANRMRINIVRDGGYNPPISTNIDLRSYLKYSYVDLAEGGFSFAGPDYLDDVGPLTEFEFHVGAVSFRLIERDGYHVPEISAHRYYEHETSTGVTRIDFDLKLKRIPLDEWPPLDGSLDNSRAEESDAEKAGNEPAIIFPNPSNASVTIGYRVTSPAHVRMDIFDPAGRLVATVVDIDQVSGSYTEVWDGSAYASGIYFCRLEIGARVMIRKLAVLK